MGYQSTWEIWDHEPTISNDTWKTMMQDMADFDDDLSYALDPSGWRYETSQDLEPIVAEWSKRYPYVIFGLYRIGDEHDDEQQWYVCNGEAQDANLRIVRKTDDCTLRPGPDWRPLEAFFPIKLCGEFMYMGTADGPNGTVHLYKHSSSRRYINLDAHGQCYEFTGDGYRPVNDLAAVVNLQDHKLTHYAVSHNWRQNNA